MTDKHTAGRLILIFPDDQEIINDDVIQITTEERDAGNFIPVCTVAIDFEEPIETEQQANARRLAAAWNAVEGIPTAALEAGVVGDLVAALEWYQEQARLCRLIHSEGDAGRAALSADGGERARATLSKAKGRQS